MRDLRGGANCNMLHCKGSFVMISLLSSIEIDPNTCVLNESKVLTHFALYDLPTQIQHPPKKRGHTTLDQVSTLLQESSKLVGGMRKKAAAAAALLFVLFVESMRPFFGILISFHHDTFELLFNLSLESLQPPPQKKKKRVCKWGEMDCKF